MLSRAESVKEMAIEHIPVEVRNGEAHDQGVPVAGHNSQDVVLKEGQPLLVQVGVQPFRGKEGCLQDKKILCCVFFSGPDLDSNGSLDLDPDSIGSVDPDPDFNGLVDLDPDSNGSVDLYPDSNGSVDLDPDSKGSVDLDPDSNGFVDLDPILDGSVDLDPDSNGSVDLDQDS